VFSLFRWKQGGWWMNCKRLVIAGTESGVGKTTVTLGIMAALAGEGLRVQGFKCGPDYIDPTFHTAVTGRVSRNLDSWMLGTDQLQAIYQHGVQDCDIAIIEGVMGLYDGRSPTSDEGSTAEVARLLDAPVMLVLNAEKAARSVAASVLGFQQFAPDVRIAGVIANFVYGDGHYRYVKEAIEQVCRVPVLGYLQPDEQLRLPERHLGLVPALENGALDDYVARLGSVFRQSVQLSRLLKIAETPAPPGGGLVWPQNWAGRRFVGMRLAVARDAAFHFYYQENFELLEAYGAELVFFSPLKGEPLPAGVNGLYLGGGFPEVFAAELAAQQDVKRSIQSAIERGLPTLAECGGFMYLARELMTSAGKRYPMVGIFDGLVRMHDRLQAIGYRTLRAATGNPLFPAGQAAKGHEFHYSTYEPAERRHGVGQTQKRAYQVATEAGQQAEGWSVYQVSAGYPHLHFASCPYFMEGWLERCQAWQNGVQ
jgi:cobyrinic acid a,c-diamide synthase